MPTAVAATLKKPMTFPRIASISGNPQRTTSLPMAHTVGEWVETMEAGTMAATIAPGLFVDELPAADCADATGLRCLHIGMESLLRSAGESVVGASEGDAYRLLVQGGELCFECVQTPATATMARIFEGHHHIAEAMRRQGCEGRWQIWINRHYLDDEPVTELLAYMSRLPGYAVATGVLPSCPKGVGVVVTKYQPSSTARVHRRSVLPLYDMNTQRPKSLIMSGGLSLHIEGPFFHRYEPMEALLNSRADRTQRTVIVVESNDMSEPACNDKELQVLLDRAPAAVAGIVLLQPESGKRGIAIAGVYARRDIHIPVLDVLARRIKK